MVSERGYERIAVTRPADANFAGCLRARMPAAVAEMRRQRAAGVEVRAIAEAFGVSRRTAYRYLADADYTEVTVAGWTATFAMSPGRSPWRVSSWRRTAAIR